MGHFKTWKNEIVHFFKATATMGLKRASADYAHGQFTSSMCPDLSQELPH